MQERNTRKPMSELSRNSTAHLGPGRPGEPEILAGSASARHFLTLGNRHYNHYLIYARQPDLEQAITHYREALALNPTLPEVHIKLASALWDRGAIPLETAIAYCDAGLALNPEAGDGYLFKGYFLHRAGRIEEALHQFRTAIRKIGGLRSAKPRLALGKAMLRQAAERAGLTRFALTARGLGQLALGYCLLPMDGPAFQALGKALMSDFAIFSILGAGRCLQGIGSHRLAKRLYAWGARTMPEETIFFHRLGDLHIERDETAAAVAYYHKAEALEPEDPIIHKKLGHVYHASQDSDEAARHLLMAVSCGGADFDVLYALGQIYSDRGDYMRALYYYKDLLAQSPDNPYLHSNIAYVLFKLEDYDGAIHEYQNAVKFGKDPVWTATVAQTLGGLYYRVRRDPEAATRILQVACRLNPDDMECLAILGDIYVDQGQFELALETYEHLASQEPDNAECHSYLGYLLWQMDRNDEAIEAYNRAIALDPGNFVAFNNLGVVWLDDYCAPEKALDVFEAAFRLKTDYTLARFNAGRACEALGRTADAARHYAAALELNAENPELQDDEIQERLESLFQI